MKKKLFINLSIRLRFIFMIMLELVCVSLISWLVMDVLHISAVPNRLLKAIFPSDWKRKSK